MNKIEKLEKDIQQLQNVCRHISLDSSELIIATKLKIAYLKKKIRIEKETIKSDHFNDILKKYKVSLSTPLILR